MPEAYLSATLEGEETRGLLRAVSVEESDRRASLATLVFGDSDLVLGDIVQEGLTVQIDLGVPDSHAVVFRGPITGLDVRYPAAETATVRVQALDSLAQLAFRYETKRWWNTTLSQVVTELATRHGMRPGTVTPTRDATFSEARPLQQVEESDLAFLQRLGKEHGCRVYVDHPEGPDALNFVSIANLVNEPPLPGALRFNDTLFDFSAQFEAFATDPAEDLVTTDPETGERVALTTQLASATDAQWVPDASRIARLGADAAAVTALVAKAAAKRASLADFWRNPPRAAGSASRATADTSGTHGDPARRLGQTARGRIAGNALLRPRKRITLEGCGGRWSGAWNVASVRHTIDLRTNTFDSHFVATR
ncbi:MAG TPA: contractile injection system protein, VgrG/Pvc8 family [Polyangiales bacterium]|nr:contractile injection system protein, VgrG/Pvc8 family [Polyangiales bacterium]